MKCSKCGGRLSQEDENFYRCDNCGAKFKRTVKQEKPTTKPETTDAEKDSEQAQDSAVNGINPEETANTTEKTADVSDDTASNNAYDAETTQTENIADTETNPAQTRDGTETNTEAARSQETAAPTDCNDVTAETTGDINPPAEQPRDLTAEPNRAADANAANTEPAVTDTSAQEAPVSETEYYANVYVQYYGGSPDSPEAVAYAEQCIAYYAAQPQTEDEQQTGGAQVKKEKKPKKDKSVTKTRPINETEFYAKLSDKQKAGVDKFTASKFWKFILKYGLTVVLPAVLVFIAFVTLLSCFAGVRGIYVSADNPNVFLSFASDHYEFYTYEYNDETEMYDENIRKGNWDVRNGQIFLTSKSEKYGKITDVYSFSKKSDKQIFLGYANGGYREMTEFNRVDLICYRDTVKKVKLEYDANGGDVVDYSGDQESNYSENLPIGSKPWYMPWAYREDHYNPETGYRTTYDFDGWYESPWALHDYREAVANVQDGDKEPVEPKELSEDNRVWKSAKYYANWNYNAESFSIRNGGTELVSAHEGDHILPLLEAADENKGFEYAYYLDKEDGTSTKITSSTRMPAKNISISRTSTAGKNYNIEFSRNNADFNFNDTYSTTFGNYFTIPNETPTTSFSNRRFDGWTVGITQNGNFTAINADKYYPGAIFSLSGVLDRQSAISFADVTEAGGIIFAANWTVRNYRVNFNGNGGSFDFSNQFIVEPGDPFDISNKVPTNSDGSLSFGGWELGYKPNGNFIKLTDYTYSAGDSIHFENILAQQENGLALIDIESAGGFVFRAVWHEISVTRDGSSFDKAYLLNVGSSKTVTISKSAQKIYFKFTPSTTKQYTIYSSNRNNSDPCVYLYDSNQTTKLHSDDDGGDDERNFKLSYQLTAGRTYYFAVYLYNDTTGSFTVNF